MSKNKQAKKTAFLKSKPERDTFTIQTEILDTLLSKRIGGSVNIKGIGFQLLYAVYSILSELAPDKNSFIRLEGLEDIDIIKENSKEYIQTKTSLNSIDAGRFWDLKIFQNYMEVYKADKNSTFTLVHNTILPKGRLDILTSLTGVDETINFWKEKFNLAGYEIDHESLKHFFSQIKVKIATEQSLLTEINKLLHKKFNVNNETGIIFLKALFYNTFNWAKNRNTIYFIDLLNLIQSVIDSFSKMPVNPALQNNWITEVLYTVPSDLIVDDYYEGKSAKPIHIAMGLPVKRPQWEEEIIKTVRKTDVTIIKSSSGQGKSTLAWLVTKTLSCELFKIYQIVYCPNWEQANAIKDFIETRLKIGENPIIVIDGLNQSVSAWVDLAEHLKDVPVKILITTREEDWIKYGADISKITIKSVEIKLTMTEAENIFQQLKKNNKLYNDTIDWQPAWEKIADKGLLIEYVYLLTSGEMIKTRLELQVRKLQIEKSAGAKTEILRLVSVADVLSIRVHTSRLTEHINKTIHFDSDRNEVYRQLEKEYYLRFNEDYIEGLHPVRSRHLMDILHSHTPIEESLIALLNLLNEDSIYDYFLSAPYLVQQEKKEKYYKEIASVMSERDFPQMVYSIDGLMHYEPTKQWKENKDIFDEVFSTGGLQLFVSDSIPFNSLNRIEKLLESMEDIPKNNLSFLRNKLNELTKYSITESDVNIFVKYLHTALSNKGKIYNPEGVVFLSKWFTKVGLSFPDIIELNEEKLLDYLANTDIAQSADLFHFFSITRTDSYRNFINTHKETIIGWIKRKTTSLTIREIENEIHITYLLDSNADKANEFSIYRINIIHSFFPNYSRYCTEAIVLPFPNTEIYKVVVDNSRKAIPAENLFDNFDIHINQIWSKTILRYYAASSAYEWQQQYFTFRQKSLELVKTCVHFFENHLINDSTKLRSLGNEFISLGNELLKSQQVLKKYPSSNQKYFEKENFIEEERDIDKFFTSLRNFINQMSGILVPQKEHDRHLPVVNLKSAEYNLSKMQIAFEKIIDKTFSYFPFSSLIKPEKQWYERLSHTVQFYIHHVKKLSKEKIIVPSRSIEQWWEHEQKKNLEYLHTVIKECEEASPFKFYLPAKIIQNENLYTVAIGIQDCDLTDSDNLWLLSLGLKDLSKTGIHFFVMIFVDENKKVIGALRFNENYFAKFNQFYDLGEFDETDEFSTPLPVFPDKSLLETLENITLINATPTSEDEPFYKMMIDVWKLTEYRSNLQETIIEKNWLQEIEQQYTDSILTNIHLLKKNGVLITKLLEERIYQFIKYESNFSKEEILEIMTDKLLKKNDLFFYALSEVFCGAIRTK